MLKPEAAEKRLAGLRGRDERLSRLQALPEPARAAGLALLQRAPDGRVPRDWDRREALQVQAQAALTAAPEVRRQVFAALHPGLAEAFEAAWRLHDHLPYQADDYEARPFRCPGGGAAGRADRAQWLAAVSEILAPYPGDIRWVAAWAAYLAPYNTEVIGVLLAGVIEAGGPDGEAVFETLAASARGEHEIGAMGRHVTTAFLSASRPDGWEVVERLLLAAQRQEGLRQAILEGAAEAHPGAFRRLLRLILEHDLQRFSSVIRAFDVWLGLALTVEKAPTVRALLSRLLACLEDPEEARRALASEDPRLVYLALWSLAFADADAALVAASGVLHDPLPVRRQAAAYLLAQLGLPAAADLLVPALGDPDLTVAGIAFQHDGGQAQRHADRFDALTALLERCPKQGSRPLEWAGTEIELSRAAVAGALAAVLGPRPPTALAPYLEMMEPMDRWEVADLLAKTRRPGPEVRDLLLRLAGDASEWVRSRAVEALEKGALRAGEAVALEKLLTRKGAALRQQVLTLLLKQPDPAALASAERLLAGAAPQRVAGLEVLRQMAEAGRAPAECRSLAAAFRADRAAPTEAEEELLVLLLQEDRAPAALDDALGLMDPAGRTPPRAPRAVPDLVLLTDAARALVRNLDSFIDKHGETPVVLPPWDEDDEDDEDDHGGDDDEVEVEAELLGDVYYGFPEPHGPESTHLPLRELWEEWWSGRPAATRDPDGFEVLRALAGLSAPKGPRARREGVVPEVLQWMLLLHPPPGAADFLLDAAETTLASIPPAVLTRVPKDDWDDGWRGDDRWTAWLSLCGKHRRLAPAAWDAQRLARYWGLLRWVDEPGVAIPRHRPEEREALAAFEAGVATRDDLLDLLLGPRPDDEWGEAFPTLHRHSRRRPTAECRHCPELARLVEQCRRRILEVELQRGDLPTAASTAALALRHAGGADVLAELVRALGTLKLLRGYSAGEEGRAAVFSHLIRATHPGPQDTPAAFSAAVAGIPEQRLLDVGFYAPQWAEHVECAVGWPGVGEAIWWVHAHTKDDQWSVDEEVRSLWTARVSERTPLAGQSLMDGAVDVEWFRRVHAALGTERWARLDESARYASGGGGHKRAQLFADAMLERARKEDLVARITGKRNQDALRALGLLPLPAGPGARAEVLARYETIQEFLRGSRQFGAQKQASEKLAAAIALENLARTAGYADPVRLEWAMEADAIADLAAGPLTATAGDVTATLAVNEWGEPVLTVARAGRVLKNVPPAARKDAGIAALQARSAEVDRQAARMRRSLEDAMCRGDVFQGAELGELLGHPVLAPMLRNLVFVGEGKAGYPVEGGQALEDAGGGRHPVAPGDALRVAHPHDLYRTGEWSAWQSDCFRRERIQPFKQVFRELYLLTDAERRSGAGSRRYAGHQVNPRQARALLGRRGWVSNPEEGDVRRTFHREGLVAWLEFDYGYTTPGEVEGLTIDTVGFSRRGSWDRVPLEDVPARLFSEVMRDVDLVVSVAHQGGVDPEATASTVEMRAALLRETCRLLKLENVRLQGSHALVDGRLAAYSVHLGSAVVHRRPGGHVCIVPVQSQHRGRLFLPFADDDPRTAEVVSKVLLLARDDEIKDPTILEQLLHT